MKQLRHFLLVPFFLLMLIGCKHWWSAADDEDDNPFQGMTAKQIYNEARTALSRKEYSAAIKRLEALDTVYPFNDYAESAGLELIYAYYEKEDYPSTAAAAERYIHLYPRSKHVDYAYYMKGMANFKQQRGPLANVLPMDASWRDPGTQSLAYSNFATLVQKFPHSKYKPNAEQRMIYLRNQFAQRELNTSLYYYARKLYVASAERASYLVETYPQAPSAKTALAVLYHSNLALGLKQASDDALAVYRATYNENPPNQVPSVDV